MAEVAAGAIAAEEVVSTTIQGGAVAGYALAQPTLPLHATFTRLGAAAQSAGDSSSLARYDHSLTVHQDHAYIFGGRTSKQSVASNDTHIISLHPTAHSSIYRAVPALPAESADLTARAPTDDPSQHSTLSNPDPTASTAVPAPRYAHSSVLVNGKLAVYGGSADPETGHPIKEAGRIWLFDPNTTTWTSVIPVTTEYPVRRSHGAAAWDGKLIIHGGVSAAGVESDTWMFYPDTRIWIRLPDFAAPQKSSISFHASPNVAVAGDMLYLITNGSQLSGQVHMLDLAALENKSTPVQATWTTFDFPTNPLTPGPRGRVGAGLVPIHTGMGRSYLLLVLGEKDAAHQADDTAHPAFWSGLWALQTPSPAATAAKLKDDTRQSVGVTSHTAEWSEVQIQAVEEKHATSGKVHPGPRGYFGCDVRGGRQAVIWGGLDAAGAVEGDGWLVDIQGPSPTALFQRSE